MFIVIEGIDGAGTTTQATLLTEALRSSGLQALRTHEPTGLPVGRLIRQVLRGPYADQPRPDVSTLPFLFAADRQDHLTCVVDPALAQGEYVVTDRYVASSLAYQSLDHDFHFIVQLNQGFRKPDLTFILDVPLDVALQRIEARQSTREIFETREKLVRVTANYERAINYLVSRGDRIVRLNGHRPQAVIATEIFNLVAAIREGIATWKRLESAILG